MQSCAGSLTNAIVLAMNLDEFGSSGDGPDRRNDRNWKNSEMNLVNRGGYSHRGRGRGGKRGGTSTGPPPKNERQRLEQQRAEHGYHYDSMHDAEFTASIA